MTTDMTHTHFVGIVYSKTTGHFTVRAGDRLLACTLGAGLRAAQHGLTATDLLTVGDQVRLAPGANGTGTIVERLPRRNVLTRRAAASRPRSLASPRSRMLMAWAASTAAALCCVPDPGGPMSTRLPRSSSIAWIGDAAGTTMCTASGKRLPSARSVVRGPPRANGPRPATASAATSAWTIA